MSAAISDRAKIRRGSTRAPAKRKTPAKRPSSASRALATIPIAPATLRRAGNWALGLALMGGIVAGVIAMKLPQMIGIEIGEAIGRAGFVVRNVEIDRKSTRLNSSHPSKSRMPSSA